MPYHSAITSASMLSWSSIYRYTKIRVTQLGVTHVEITPTRHMPKSRATDKDDKQIGIRE
jgi:hypothetical protein